MSSLARTLSFDDSTMWSVFSGGRKLGVPLAFFARLLNATPEQCQDYMISGGGSGLHWDLDEDISLEYLLLGIGDRPLHGSAAA